MFPQTFTTLFELFSSAMLAAGVVASSFIAPDAVLELESTQTVIETKESHSLTLRLKANTPVQAVTGTLHFSPQEVTFSDVAANTELTDWEYVYTVQNTPGTLSFLAVTDNPETLIGSHLILTAPFVPAAPGDTEVTLQSVRILSPMDTLSLLDAPVATLDEHTINTITEDTLTLTVIQPGQTTDLNHNDTQDIVDIGMFMSHFTTQNRASDFNDDGYVTTKDLYILLQAY